MALRRNILLFHQGALGDFVLTWPVAMALARIYPQSRVFYVTQGQKGALAERALRVEWADAETGWHALFADGDVVLREPCARLLGGAHSVVSFFSAPGSTWSANVARIAPDAKVLSIDPTPPDAFAGHATDYQLEQLRPWPAAHAGAEQVLRSLRARGLAVARPAPPAGVLVHPGSGSPQKNWPPDRFVELVGALRAAGVSVRVLLGEVERERWPADTVSRLEALAPVAWPQDLSQLASELLSAAVFVGNDSGPGHLAAILGVPTLSLFGPTDPARWSPVGPRVDVLRSQPLESLGVDAVLARVRALLG